MKNANYNLVKMLLNKLDVIWRIEKHYLHDAAEDCARCTKLVQSILKSEQKNVDLLRKEIARHKKRSNLE